MTEMASFKVAMAETGSLYLKSLGFEGKIYDSVSELLRQNEFEVLYECSTSVLTVFQRELYERFLSNVPRGLRIFLDPIVLSFALKDACDFSGVVYVWLDLDGRDDAGSSAWTRREDQVRIIGSVVGLLKRHLEKYILDVYDRETREDLASVWDAQMRLEACPVCGSSSPERKLIVASRMKLRGWVCHDCSNHIILPSDALEFLSGSMKREASR
jgi:hypothetical protein